MSDKELYQQMKQAQLNEWKAEVARLKAKASWLKADIQQGMNKQIKMLESKIKENNSKLSLLAEIGEDSWESIKHVVESAYDTLKSTIRNSSAKFIE